MLASNNTTSCWLMISSSKRLTYASDGDGTRATEETRLNERYRQRSRIGVMLGCWFEFGMEFRARNLLVDYIIIRLFSS